ncbi:MAG: hypothetical protein COA78_07305 [Blastopirellula sp.]|nr:MAG: hypothetical protein COA78_07305 [Blastopirellula sp.]
MIFQSVSVSKALSICCLAVAFHFYSLQVVEAKEVQHWHTNYAKAVKSATRHQKRLLILFINPEKNELAEQFEDEVLADAGIRSKLKSYELAKLSTETLFMVDGEETRLMEHDSFSHLYQDHGIAVVDYSNRDSENFGYVVSAFGFRDGRFRSIKETKTILELPPGSLTQRTLIYAVRMHPEQPKSSGGLLRRLLSKATQSHSELQANITLQGHHSWETRFHEISAKLPAELVPTEVCAESWPGQNLEDAAIECVRSWRHSSGHWSAVSDKNVYYGYDMKRGNNGTWYATGIFARKR